MPFVYMLRCGDGSLYTGYTTDLPRRLREHNQGTASRYTRSRRPVQYVYVEEHPDKSAALKREQAIKRLRKPAKEALAQGLRVYSGNWTDYINTGPPGEDNA